ncbi:MAG: hypothetical protein ACOYXS_07150 [Chloroflexota bacterium]
MQHSIAAKYAVRPAARFVRTSPRARERRLGLRPTGSFQAAPARATVLRHVDLGPFVQLRASWRTIRPARSPRSVSGLLRPDVTIRWARSGRSGPGLRPSAAPAPWRG